jgi:tripartite-type tricarboxylate transporter receptor subunit TctC
MRRRLQDLGMETVANRPAEFGSMIQSEILQWAKLIRDAGIKVSE